MLPARKNITHCQTLCIHLSVELDLVKYRVCLMSGSKNIWTYRSNIKGANPKTGPNSESHPKLEAEERQTLLESVGKVRWVGLSRRIS